MDAIATPGMWKRTLWQCLAFAALLLSAYLFVPLAPFIALTLPLIVCPAYEQGDEWFALLLPLAPALAFVLAGGDLVIGVLLLLCPYLCLLFAALGRRRRMPFHTSIALAAAAFLLSALGLLLRLTDLLGSPLFTQLSNTVITAIQQSSMSGSILYRLAQVGFLPIPDVYANSIAWQFGNLILISPALKQELLNMLRLRLTEGFSTLIPSMLVQGALIIGLFTALLTARTRVRKSEKPTLAPAFRALNLSRREQGYMLLLCVITLFTAFSSQSFYSLLSSLTYAGFATVYRLLGAAVFVFLLSRRHPERKVLYGFLAALLYLVMPIVLFVLGITDQFIHLRAIRPNHHKEEL